MQCPHVWSGFPIKSVNTDGKTNQNHPKLGAWLEETSIITQLGTPTLLGKLCSQRVVQPLATQRSTKQQQSGQWEYHHFQVLNRIKNYKLQYRTAIQNAHREWPMPKDQTGVQAPQASGTFRVSHPSERSLCCLKQEKFGLQSYPPPKHKNNCRKWPT